jgi:flagellar protein FliS
MMNGTRSSALRFYRDSGNAVAACDASPHRLISMLYDGILQRLAHALDALAKGDRIAKVRSLDSTLAIVDYLKAILDHQAGGDTARQLDMLYDYMQRRLVVANVSADAEAVREVMRLTTTIKSAWEAIAPEKMQTGNSAAVVNEPLRAAG